MKNITIIAGARPNFMKIAPIIHAIHSEQDKGLSINYRLVHTGQHFDQKMSGDFFTQLNIPHPHVNLESGGGTQAEQTANIMVRFEKELMSNPTELVLVVGDVTSTMACAIVAQKLGVKVAHVEAGIRSNDWSMPEEINRLVTDAITNFFFTTSSGANENLLKCGISSEKIFFVGNTMIDTLIKQEPFFTKPTIWDEKRLREKSYLVLTLHRPANVDNPEQLFALMSEITSNSKGLPILFPVHPRTRQKLKEISYQSDLIEMLDPMSYLDFNYLVKNCLAVITDSGGITEETTVMGIPCMTLRDNTERPETVTEGTNELIGTDPSAIAPAMEKLFNGEWKKGHIPQLWDGKSGYRIIKAIMSF
jgi:UDP-N-acetylglucosamine 2-epimerase (non-hydrolysing)